MSNSNSTTLNCWNKLILGRKWQKEAVNGFESVVCTQIFEILKIEVPSDFMVI